MSTSGANGSAGEIGGRSPAIPTYRTASGQGALIGPPNPPNGAEARSPASSRTVPGSGPRPTRERGSHP
jgi:hypothetical protein